MNFEEQGFQQRNLASAFDKSGPGELFSGTLGSKSVTLANVPYIDFSQIKNYNYSATYGLTGSYQPITIVLNDGTIVYNFTNYIGLTQNELDSTSSNYQYLHSGKEIIFNRDIGQDFRVYYQYEPSYLRYRIIFRSNSPVKISPTVDAVTVKMKLHSSVLGENTKRV